jgi:hypothetical protein
MGELESTGAGDQSEAKLPRRDLILLPLVSLLTIAVLLVAAEGLARYFFYSQRDFSCEVDDAAIGFRFRPYCKSRDKFAESEWIDYSFNDCGYRSKESCGPKPAGTSRIVILGASAAEGYLVAYDETFATRTANQLTQQLGRPVEIQNLGREQCYPLCIYHRMDEALALKPDLLLIALSPIDFDRLDPAEVAGRNEPMKPVQDPLVFRHKLAPRNILSAVQDFVAHSKAGIAALHFLFQNPETYVRMNMLNGEHANYLRSSFSPAWEQRLEGSDVLLGEMAQKAHDAHVPVALVELPSLGQAALLSMKVTPPGLDPYAFNKRLREIADRHGILFIDALDAFRHGPGANKLYYVVDGHMNGQGSALLSGTLTDQLIEGERNALLGQEQVRTQPAPERGK